MFTLPRGHRKPARLLYFHLILSIIKLPVKCISPSSSLHFLLVTLGGNQPFHLLNFEDHAEEEQHLTLNYKSPNMYRVRVLRSMVILPPISRKRTGSAEPEAYWIQRKNPWW